jgi:hypothetical protein
VIERVVFNVGPRCERYSVIYPKAAGFVNFKKIFPVYDDGQGGLFLEQTDTPLKGLPLSKWGLL